jgi:serine/threonine protein kinase
VSQAAKEKEIQTRHRKIGAYRVLGEIGRGGMGVVYRGIHETLQREVAIKELLPETRDGESQSRFRREALALATFRHQSIVTLYDLVEKNDSEFMILEYVDGPTLSELIRESPLPPDVAAVIGARVASALEQAHFAHIIHRDIKPANVMITKSGEVKLMDFGIAKDEGLAQLTREGVAIGTPAYMSPEQVTGGTVDGRTDIFALGTVLYECLTGTKPFHGKNAGEVFAKIRDGKCAPLGRLAPKVPKGLVQIIEKAMRTKLDKRYQDASELRRDLEVFTANEVRVSYNALLVAFLHHRQKITETEALARLSSNDLSLGTGFDRRSQRGPGRWIAFGTAVAAAGATGWFTRALWLPYASRVWPLLSNLVHLPHLR